MIWRGKCENVYYIFEAYIIAAIQLIDGYISYKKLVKLKNDFTQLLNICKTVQLREQLCSDMLSIQTKVNSFYFLSIFIDVFLIFPSSAIRAKDVRLYRYEWSQE